MAEKAGSTVSRTAFSIFLAHRRHQVKLTQRGLAKALSMNRDEAITQTKIHGWECGARAPHARYLMQLFDILRLSREDEKLALILLAQT